MTFSALSQSITCWNNLLDWTTGCIVVRGSTSCLPKFIKEAICTQYFTQAKSLTYGLFVMAWLNGTIGNPWINRTTAYVISSLVIVPTAGLVWRYQKAHIMDLATLPKAKFITAIALPVIFGIVEPVLLYKIGMYNDVSFYISFPVNIWTAYGTIVINISAHVALLESSRKTYIFKAKDSSGESIAEIPTIDTDSIESKVVSQSFQLEKEIAELKQKIKKLDEFILNNPELKKAVTEALKNYRPIYANYVPRSRDDLDPNDPIDRMTLLTLKKIDLQCDLEERMEFIESNTVVYECFKKHIANHSTSPTGEILSLLPFEQ